MKVIGLDEQTGFTKEKGCQHGQAALMAMLRKRSEHNNKDTWVLLIDLVKAFDTVNRDCLIFGGYPKKSFARPNNYKCF